MGFLNNIFSTIGGWFGGNKNDQQQQQSSSQPVQQQSQAAAPAATPISQLNGRESNPNVPKKLINLQPLSSQNNPTPPQQTQPAQQQPWWSNALKSVGSVASQIGGGIASEFTPKSNGQGQGNLAYDALQPLSNAQNYIQHGQTPTIPGAAGNFDWQKPSTYGIGVNHAALGILNPIIKTAGDTALDTANEVGQVVGSGQLPSYSDLRSPLSKLGYQAGGQINAISHPQDNVNQTLGINQNLNEAVGNAGGSINYLSNFLGGAKALDLAQQPVEQGLKELAQQGAKVGATLGGMSAGGQALYDNKGLPLPQQLLNSVIPTASGVIGGSALGGAVPLVSHAGTAALEGAKSLTGLVSKAAGGVSDLVGNGASALQRSLAGSGAHTADTIASDIGNVVNNHLNNLDPVALRKVQDFVLDASNKNYTPGATGDIKSMTARYFNNPDYAKLNKNELATLWNHTLAAKDGQPQDASELNPVLNHLNRIQGQHGFISPDLLTGGLSSKMAATADTPANLASQPLLKVPQTVGDIAQQASTQGGVHLPDTAFNADMRTNAANPADNIDVPTFLRQNAQQIQQNSASKIADIDRQIATIQQGNNPQVQKFQDAQAIANAYKESPAKGQAMAKIVSTRNQRVDPAGDIQALMQQRAGAVADANAARSAGQAQGVLDANGLNPSEVSSGIHSVNPNQEAEAAAPALKQQADAAALQAAATPPPPPNHQGDLEAMINGGASKQAVQEYLSGLPLAQQQEALASVKDMLPHLPDETKMPAPASEPTAQTAAPAPEATPAPVPTPDPMPQQPISPINTGPTVPAAPLSHDQLVSNLGPIAEGMKGNYSQRQPVNLADLKSNAAGSIANMSDDDLLRSFQSANPATMIHDSQSMALSRAALDRFSQHPEDPAAVQAVTNIMNALDQYKSQGGVTLRMAQEEFNSIPLPMKVRYIINKIDTANANTPNYQRLATNPEAADMIERNLTGLLGKSQSIADTVAQLEGKMEQNLKSGGVSAADNNALGAQINQQRQNLAAQNGEAVKYFTSLVPGQTKAQQALSSFPRTMMLGSFTGRANDIATTTANAGQLSVANLVQGGLSKVVNHFKPGLVSDTSKGFGQLASGTIHGAAQSVKEFGGTQFVPDLKAAIDSNSSLRSGMQRATGPIGRTVQNMTELATNLSDGIRSQRVYQLADQEAAKLGLSGADRQAYAAGRSFVPSDAMQQSANDLKMGVNNLNDNPLTRALNGVSKSIKGDTAVGGFMKNQIMPFTSWAGGNIWNSITDRNVVANAVKIAGSATKGDAEGVVRNISKLATNGATAYGLGYLLSKSGVLTNTDAQGYTDGGAYMHVGDHYIPVGFFGAFAPSMIMGNAAYNGINNNGGKNALLTTAEQAATNLGKSINAMGALGQTNNLSKSIAAGSGPGHTVWDGVSTFLGGAAGQFIPAAAGDVNAVLDHGIPGIPGSDALNPTHEATNTKAINTNSPSGSAKDVIGTAVNKLENRIPVLSQSMPRSQGVAAADLIDRTTHGNSDTATSIQNRANVQSAADFSKSMKQQDIPDYSAKIAKGGASFADQVQTKVENGEYDKAVKALQAQLDHTSKDKSIPPSKIEAQQDTIDKLTVARDNKTDPKILALYTGKGSDGISLAEWRNLGDPNKDTYNPKLYQDLYNYDSELAKAGVSKNSLSASDNFYTAKTPAKGGGKTNLSNGNTIGSPASLGKVSLGSLASKAIGVSPMPVIPSLSGNNLVQKRQISVSRVQ